MSVGEVILIWFLVLEVLWIVSLVRGKIRRKIILKDWVNSTFHLIVFLGVCVTLQYLMVSIIAIGVCVLNDFYPGLGWESIAFLNIAVKTGPWILLLGVLIFLRYFFRYLLYFTHPNFMCIWKYTKEEIQCVKDKKASNKEKFKSKHPRLYKIIYKEKKEKKPSKHPKLEAFLNVFGDPPKEV
jgi:hypothetical protein